MAAPSSAGRLCIERIGYPSPGGSFRTVDSVELSVYMALLPQGEWAVRDTRHILKSFYSLTSTVDMRISAITISLYARIATPHISHGPYIQGQIASFPAFDVSFDRPLVLP